MIFVSVMMAVIGVSDRTHEQVLEESERRGLAVSLGLRTRILLETHGELPVAFAQLMTARTAITLLRLASNWKKGNQWGCLALLQ